MGTGDTWVCLRCRTFSILIIKTPTIMKFSIATESQYDMTTVNGYATFDVSKLDMKKVEFFEKKYPDLVKKLDRWILSPDQDLISHLIKLGKIVEGLYGLGDIVIYRGMTVSRMVPKYQETMGLTEKTWYGTLKLKKEVVPGYKFDYTAKNATSFSWDLSVARAFGNVVVSGVSKKGTPRLIITDELDYVVSKLRNLEDEGETQREVIVFPPSKLSCKVLSI